LFFRDLLGEEEPASPWNAEVLEFRGIDLMGCRLGTNPSAFARCLNRKVDRRVKTAARGLRRQLARAQRDARRAAQQAARETKRAADVQKTLDQANRQLRQFAGAVVVQTDWQKTLLAGLQHLPLGNLVVCMQNQALAGNLNYAAAIQQFASNPVQFVDTVLRDVLLKGTQEFGQLVTKELTALVEKGELPRDTELVSRSLDNLGAMIGQEGAGKCVLDEVRPHVEAASVLALRLARETVQTLEAKARELIEKQMIPALMKPSSELLNSIIVAQIRKSDATSQESLPPQISALMLTEDELKAIARQVLFKRNVQKRFEVANVSLEKLLDPNTAQTQVQTHIADLQKLTKGTEDFEALYGEIAIKIIQAMGHKFVHSKVTGHGGYLLDKATALLAIVEDTVGNVVKGLCGLIPEAGAGVAAFIFECVDILWNQQAMPALLSFAQQLMEQAVDMMADAALTMLQDGKSMKEIQGATDKLGPLAALLRGIPHEQLVGAWAGAILKDEMAMFERHFSQVHGLAQKRLAAS
jgi:hypothetical protein